MAISDEVLSRTLSAYLDSHPDEISPLSEPMRLLSQGRDFASRETYPMHATAGALLTRGRAEVLLVEHRAYGIHLQPGGHLEPVDSTLVDAAMRELIEEIGIDPYTVELTCPYPVYVEFGLVPARPEKQEPAHFHLDFGYSFITTSGDIGRVQESEVRGAGWYALEEAEALVGPRIARAR